MVSPFSREPRWPDLERSIGKLVHTKGQKKCWEAVGPARAAFLTLGLELKDYLDNNTESRPGSEKVTFSIYMIGRSKARASPTILFCSEDSGSRKTAHEAVKQSGLMERYPGIRTATALRAPEIESHGPLEPLALDTIPHEHVQTSNQPGMNTFIHVSNNRIFTRQHLDKLSKAHLATLGGIVRRNDEIFVFTAGHPFETVVSSDSSNNCTSDDEGWELDSDRSDHDSDITDIDECIEGAAPNDEEIATQTGAIDTCYKSTSGPATAISDLSVTPPTSDSSESPTTAECRIDALSSGLDYALIKVSGSDPLIFGEAVEGPNPLSNWHLVYSVPVGIQDAKIVSYVASSGFLTGTLSATPSYIRMSDRKSFQMTYRVDFDGPIFKGDCGSWILDAETQGLYGHIIAGCEGSTIAYIVPSISVMEDAQKHLGPNLQLYCHPAMHTERSVVENIPSSINSELEERILQNYFRNTESPTRARKAAEGRKHLSASSRAKTTTLVPEKPSILKGQASYTRRQVPQKVKYSFPEVEYSESLMEEEIVHYLLRDDIGSDISPEADAVEDFCRGTSLATLQAEEGAGTTPVALFDQRSSDNGDSHDNTNLSPLTAWGLYQKLKETSSTSMHGTDFPSKEKPRRRLIFIMDLDARTILALIRTASVGCIPVLRSAIYRHLRFEAVISATFHVDNNTRFSLSFHLPYYAWRPGKGNKDHGQHQNTKNIPRLSHNVSFLDRDADGQADNFLHEAEISCIATGVVNELWEIYCWVDSYFDTTATGETPTRYQVDTAKSSEGFVPDPLTRGHTFVDRPLQDPRECFLKVLGIRLYQVRAEWQQVVDKLQLSLRRYETTHLIAPTVSAAFHDQRANTTKKNDLQAALTYIKNAQEISKRLFYALSKTLSALDTFPANHAVLFQDLVDSQGSSWITIVQATEDLNRLSKTLEAITVNYEDHAKNLNGLMSLEMSHQALDLTIRQLEHQTALDKYNTLLTVILLFVSPIIATAGLFSMEPAVLPFPSTFLSFVIVLFSLVLVLLGTMLFDQLSPPLNSGRQAVEVWLSKMFREGSFGFRRPPSDIEDLWVNSVDNLPRFSKEWNTEMDGRAGSRLASEKI